MFNTRIKQDKSDRKRKIILRAALKIFGEKGYHYATLSQIASEAGVSRGLIHFYFENKLDLFISLMLVFLEKLNSTHQQVLTRVSDPVQKLHLYFTVISDIILKDDDSLYWGNILKDGFPKGQMLKSEGLREKYERIIEENKTLVTAITDIIKQAQTKGVIDNTIPPQILSFILGGSSQLLYYGLFLHRTRSTIIINNSDSAESINESNIKKAMDILINKFIL
jgi:TetR/AcrR family transcriptional regulator, fatty acid metabolism regulator protein